MWPNSWCSCFFSQHFPFLLLNVLPGKTIYSMPDDSGQIGPNETVCSIENKVIWLANAEYCLYIGLLRLFFEKFCIRPFVLIFSTLKAKKNISNISKSTFWFRGWKLMIDLTHSHTKTNKKRSWSSFQPFEALQEFILEFQSLASRIWIKPFY